MPPAEAGRFGVLEIDEDYRIVGLRGEAAARPSRALARSIPTMVSASMGIYVFNTDVLLRALHEDAQDPDSSHDFGKDVIPRMPAATAA